LAAAHLNVEREGVADRVEIRTADMRAMPFADATFDVVVSRAVIHNVYSKGDRAQAVQEIARVLKPGGVALIDDIRHHNEYGATFAEHHCTEVRWIGSQAVRVLLAIMTMGGLSPATLLVRRPKPNQAAVASLVR
jgi:ubiquinone/menaquinone biosynthesis C-methylase UbiE